MKVPPVSARYLAGFLAALFALEVQVVRTSKDGGERLKALLCSVDMHAQLGGNGRNPIRFAGTWLSPHIHTLYSDGNICKVLVGLHGNPILVGCQS